MNALPLLTRIAALLVHRTPAIGWLRTYPRTHLPSDLIDGSALETAREHDRRAARRRGHPN